MRQTVDEKDLQAERQHEQKLYGREALSPVGEIERSPM